MVERYRSVRFIFLIALFVGASFFSALAYADCTGPAAIAGKIIYESAGKTVRYCNGTDWIDTRMGGDPELLASLSDTANRLRFTRDVVISGNYAYVAGSYTVGVIDISDINNPVGVTNLYDNVNFWGMYGLAVNGNYLYGMTSNGRLNVFDISAPAAPVRIATLVDATNLPGAKGIFFSGGHIYVTITQGLAIVDVSTPSAPVYRGKVTSAGTLSGAESVYVVGNYAYVAAFTSDRLVVINVTTKTAPTISGSVTDAAYLDGAWGVYVAGNYAYVTAYVGNDFAVVDITNPAAPAVVAGIQTGGANLHSPGEICANGSVLYTSNSGVASSGSITTISIANPLQPFIMANLFIGSEGVGQHCAVDGTRLVKTGGSEDNVLFMDISAKPMLTAKSSIDDIEMAQTHAAVTSGSYLYGVDLPYNSITGRLYVYDISTPSTPSLVSKTLVAANCTGLAKSGNYLFAICGNSFIPIDVSTPSAPVLLTPLAHANLTGAQKVAVSGNYAFVTSTAGRVTAVDITTPATPAVVGSLLDTTNLTVGNHSQGGGITIVGNYLYVSMRAANRLSIVDISTPATPVLAGTIQDATNLASVMDVKVVGNYAYAVMGSRLSIFDISTPSSITLTGTLASGSFNSPTSIEVSGNYAYVACGYNPGMVVTANISNPAAPSYVGGVAGTGVFIPIELVLSGSSLFSFGYTGFVTFSLAAPSAPANVGRAQYLGTTSGIEGIAMNGNYAYSVNAGSLSRHIVVRDISNLSNVPAVGSLVDNTNLLNPADVKYDAGHLYVADRQSGLQIYSVASPTAPVRTGGYYNATYMSGAVDVVVSGNYAYFAVCNVDRFTIVDITNKAAPALAGSVANSTLMDCPSSVYVSGNYAYVGSQSDSIVVIDITNKASPVIVGSVTDATSLDNARGLTLNGTTLAAITATSNVTLVDVSTPTAPVVLQMGGAGSNYLGQLQLYGGYFLTSTNFAGAYVVDPNVSGAPILAQSLPACISSGSGATPSNALLGDVFLVSSNGRQIICVTEVSSVSYPSKVASYFNDTNQLEGADFVEVSGNYAFVIANGSDRLTTIDISNPLAPSIVASKDFAQINLVTGLSISGNHLFVTSDSASQTYIFDISNPLLPTVVASTNSSCCYPSASYLDGNYLYSVRDSYDRISISDVTNPLAPVAMGNLTNAVFNTLLDVTASGNYAYVADWSTSIHVINVTNKASPVLLTTLTDATNLPTTRVVAVSGNYLYVGAGSRFTVVDVTTPASPVVVASIVDAAKTNSVKSIKIYGSTAFVGGGTGLTMVDISVPTAPVIVGHYDQGVVTSVSGFTVVGNYAYVVESNDFNTFRAIPPPTNGACTSAGKIEYNFASHVLQFCNGSNWYPMAPFPGAGGAGCSSPTGVTGATNFNSVSGKLRFCDGATWTNVD